MYLDSIKLSARVSWWRVVMETGLFRTEALSSPVPRGLAEEKPAEDTGSN